MIKKTIYITQKPRFSMYGFDINVPIKDEINVKNLLEFIFAIFIVTTGTIVSPEQLVNPYVQAIIGIIGVGLIYTAISAIEFFVSKIDYLEFDENSEEIDFIETTKGEFFEFDGSSEEITVNDDETEKL